MHAAGNGKGQHPDTPRTVRKKKDDVWDDSFQHIAFLLSFS